MCDMEQLSLKSSASIVLGKDLSIIELHLVNGGNILYKQAPWTS